MERESEVRTSEGGFRRSDREKHACRRRGPAGFRSLPRGWRNMYCKRAEDTRGQPSEVEEQEARANRSNAPVSLCVNGLWTKTGSIPLMPKVCECVNVLLRIGNHAKEGPPHVHHRESEGQRLPGEDRKCRAPRAEDGEGAFADAVV